VTTRQEINIIAIMLTKAKTVEHKYSGDKERSL